MRHVISGGSGFTGAALTRQLLKRGDEIVNFDLKPPADAVLASSTRFVCGDIRKPDDLARLGLGPDDVVYHLAARQFADAVPRRGRDAWFYETNVKGTQNVVDAMRAGGASRLVYFSTDMTYGKPKTCPVPPDHLQNPLGPYGRGKLAAENVLRGTKGIQATIFRPRLITGPGRLGILGKLFALIRAGLPVPMIGSGANRYQMVGVEDCARAAILAMEAGCPPGPFNLGSATPPTTRQLLQGIIEHAKSRSLLLPVPAALLKPMLAAMDTAGLTLLFPEQFGIADIDILLDTSDTRRILGWAPEHGDIDMMTAAYDAFAR
jgi:nucleoside-diphosphate-sugar epimerase